MNSFFRVPRVVAFVVSVLALLAALLTGDPALSQTFRGTILGTVTDSSGAAVPGAGVTIKNLDTGLNRSVSTSEDGSYSAPELPIGNYSVTVEKAGFKTGVVAGAKVEVSSERRVDFVLQPGQLSQTVEVQGEELPLIESTSNTLGGIVESKVVTTLPINGRDYQKLIFLVPGVTGSPDQITDSPGSFGIFSVNGARGRANNFLLDGTDMNDGYRNDPAINEAGVFGTPATILPVEAIAELHVASNFEAEYGRSAGAVVNVVTKSGTNQLHGSVFEFFRNNALDARNYFDVTSLPQNPFHNNQFGGSLGGPIIKDKTFFFIDYEGLREVGSQSEPSCVPTATDIANNTPSGGINPVIQNLINAGKAWPSPNGTGSCIASQSTVMNPVAQTAAPNGFNTILQTPFDNFVNGGIIKIDHQINKDNTLTGRYFLGDSEQSFPLALVGGGALPGYNTFTPTRVQLVSISLVSILTPSVLNEVRVGWNRFAEGFFAQDRHFDPATIGLMTGGKGNDLGLPRFDVGSFPLMGANSGDTRHRVDSNWHYIDNISWKHSKHDIKFGYEFRRTSVTQFFDSYFKGRLNFSSLAHFLSGVPDSGFQYSGNSDRNTYENSHAVYIQDSYRMSPRLTLNLGLRYDYYGIIQEKHGNFTNFDPITGAPSIVGAGRLYQPDYNNAAPRVSVAWDVTGHQKTVVRAGFGIFYDAYSQDMFQGHLPFNSNYDPGVAYSGFGPNPISVAQAETVAPLGAFKVFGFPSRMSDRFGVDQNLRTPYMENYNLNLQQQITRRMTLQVSYVGSQGHKLLRFRDLNQPTLAMIQAYDYHHSVDSMKNVINAGGCCTPGVFTGGGTYYNFEEASGNSIYNSLQTSYHIDNWHGFSTTFNYTWSHSLDDSSDGEDYVPNAAQPDNSQAANRFNRGNSNFDVRNRIAWNFVYELPNAPGSSWRFVRNGWGVSGTVTIQAGQPFHLNYNFEDDYNGTGEFFARPDVVAPLVYHQSDPNNFLQLTSFAVPCTLDGNGTAANNCISINPASPDPTGVACDMLAGKNGGMNTGGCINTMHFGNEGRNSLLGPHFRQFDFSIFKKTQLTERLNMELRFEGYNVLNHPNFANPYLPNFIADAAQNGINANGTSAGALRLTATGDVGIGYPFLGSGGPRSLQVAAKFTF